MALWKLARAAEIPPGQTRFVWAGEAAVLLVNYRGAIYALSGICPHRNNPLEGAVLWGHLVDCPYHHFQYDVRTGENHFPKNVYPEDMPQLEQQVRPLRSYRVEVREGDVWVDLG
ncbi:MAG TPA: Rieske 2Fe-2S domain-containing protein [Bryobacteraceae bacterium]|nr:Rieske 2Fe-2S domain-containing protein [Bryobacteraceae bacterium]